MLLLVPQVPLHTGEHKINFKEIRPIKFNLIAIFNTVSAEHERKKEEKKESGKFFRRKIILTYVGSYKLPANRFLLMKPFDARHSHIVSVK